MKAWIPLVLGAALLAGGCSSSDDVPTVIDDSPVASEADTNAITEVVTTVVAGKNTGQICNQLLDADMVKDLYSRAPTCRRLVAAPAGEAAAATAEVTDVDVEGARGTAVVTATGGAADGATGTWHFVRTPKGWKVEEWGVDYLRSVVLAIFGPRYTPTSSSDPLGSQPVRVCVNGQFQDKDDAEFLTAAKTYLRGGKPAEKLLAAAVKECGDPAAESEDSEG